MMTSPEKRILQSLKKIKNLLSQQAPQLLKEFKIKSLLTLIVENFFSEMTAGLYDMPLQIQGPEGVLKANM